MDNQLTPIVTQTSGNHVSGDNEVKHDGKENFMVEEVSQESRNETNMVEGEFGAKGSIDDEDFSDKFLAIVSTLENTNSDHGTSDVQGETKCSEQSASGSSNTLHAGLLTNSSYQDDPEVNDNNTTTQICGQPSQPNQGQLGMGRSVVPTGHVVQSSKGVQMSQRTDLKEMYNMDKTGQSNLPSIGRKGSVTQPEARNDENGRSFKHSEDCEDNS